MSKTEPYSINIGGELLSLEKPVVMGILNATPDSFYQHHEGAEAIRLRTRQILDEGATILDVGACSTRPGFTPPDEQEEMRRLREALAVVRQEAPRAVLSVDTPLVPLSLLQELLTVQRETDCDVAITEHGGVWEPLIGVYHSALADDAKNLLREGRRSVRALLECADTRLVPFSGDERLLLNCNDPEDYAQLLSLYAHEGRHNEENME